MTELKYEIKPITAENYETVNGDCWDTKEAQQKLFETQGILGFGAWDDEVCIGSLHCYKVYLPDWNDSFFPDYGRRRLEDWPLGWPLKAAKEKQLSFPGPVWGHSCFHVGRLINTHHSELKYLGQGIGKALLAASINWAKSHDYSAIVAIGGSKIVPKYNVVMGCLPYTTYANNSFHAAALEEDGRAAPWWTTDCFDDPTIKAQVEEALKDNNIEDMCARLMVLDL